MEPFDLNGFHHRSEGVGTKGISHTRSERKRSIGFQKPVDKILNWIYNVKVLFRILIGGRSMDANIRAINSELTQLYKWEDELYHRYGVFCGLSDPAVWILYGLYEDTEQILTQNDLVSTWFYPKQTINYTVNALVKRGLVKLEQLPVARNSKVILLTEEGRRICEEKMLPLMQAEENSLSRMTEQERELLLRLAKKQMTYFEEEIRKITGGQSKKAL